MKLSSLLSKKAKEKNDKRQQTATTAANDDCPMCVVSPDAIATLKNKKSK